MRYLALLILFMSCTVFGQTYIKGPALIEGVTNTVTVAGTTQLTKDSQTNQIFTGVANQFVVLPNATTVPIGRRFYISNESTGVIIIDDFGVNELTRLQPGASVSARLTVAGGTNGTWDFDAKDANSWFLTGNAGTTAGTNFLGTTDSQSLVFKTANTEWMRILSTGEIGIGTSVPTTTLMFDGNATRTISTTRSTSGAGNVFTVSSGGALSGGTDLNGGNLAFRSGISTGTGSSSLIFQTYTPAASTGTADNTVSTKMTIAGNGNIGMGAGSPAANLTVAGNRTISSAIGSAVGSVLELTNAILSDIATGAGTVANFNLGRVGSYTYSPTNAVIVTNAAGLRVNPPIATTNATFTNVSAIYAPTNAVQSASGVVTNSYALNIAAQTGATNNYAATISGNVGMGGVTDPLAMLDTAASGVTVGTNEQLSLRSQRAAIASGNLIGGISYRSNDTNLTAPGTIVATEGAVASATHTASVLDTDWVVRLTSTLSLAEVFRIGSTGILDTTYGTGILHSNASGVISSSAISLTADVTGILPSANGGTGVNNAGSFTYGANNITFTTGGVTSLTLPTSGTVDTLAGAVTLSNKTLASPIVTSGTSFINNAATIYYEATANGSNNIGITAPNDMLNASYSMTLPDGQGAANQSMVNNGSGTLSWVTPAQFYGSAIWPGTTSCLWSSTSGSVAVFAADTDCPAPTVTGSVSAPGTKIPGIVLTSAAAGKYEVCVSYTSSFTGVNGGAFDLKVTSGTVTNEASPQINPGFATTTRFPVSMCSSFTVASPNTVQVELRGAAGSATTINIDNSTSTFTQMVFNVKRFP